MSRREYQPPVQYEEVRRRLRAEGEIEVRERALHLNTGSVRTTLMAGGFREHGEVPDRVTQIYDPVEHTIIFDLPDPAPEEGDR